MEGDTRFEFEERDGLQLKYYAGEPGNYVGVTERTGKRKKSLLRPRAAPAHHEAQG